MEKIRLTIVGLIAFSGLFLPISSVFSADVDSKGYVNFEQKDEPAIGGPLRIDGVSVINFGTQALKGDTVVYNSIYTNSEVNTEGKYVPMHVETMDNRGTNEGWQLQAKHSRQFSEIDNAGTVVPGGSILTGSELNLTATESYDNGSIKEGDKLKPSGLKSKVALNTDFQTLINSNANEGIGSWSTYFGATVDTVSTPGQDKDGNPIQVPEENKSITLTVPGKTAKKEMVRYEAELTWTLLSTPE